MTPPIATFPSSELPKEARLNGKGDFRKGWDGRLKNCELFELLQYECDVQRESDGSVNRNSRVVCQPVERFFRRCRDRDGIFTVETTLWEKSGKN